MRKLFRFLLGAMACGILLYSGSALTTYYRESSASTVVNESLSNLVVSAKEAPEKEPDPQMEAVPEEPEQSGEAAPIDVDFEVLLEANGDVVAWLYSENTNINLPVVQGKNNDYYLRRMIDGNWNPAGTLFLDYRNGGDFSDGNSVIYGHNMKDKTMFASLVNYKKQEYFDEHPVMWLLTPEVDYKLELVAGCVTTYNSQIYTFGLTAEDAFPIVEAFVGDSTFRSGFEFSQGDRFVTFSTCSYEFDDARYVLIGKMVPLE